MKAKTFDCLEMKPRGAEKVREQTKGMTLEQELEFWQERSRILKQRKMRIPTEWRTPLAEGRLLILSPFAVKQHRATTDLSEKRNAFVAALADKIFVAHAASGSKTEQFCRELLRRGKPVLTLESSENANVLSLGAFLLDISSFEERWSARSLYGRDRTHESRATFLATSRKRLRPGRA